MKSLTHTHHTVGALQSVLPKCVSVTSRHLHFGHQLVFAQIGRLLLQRSLTTPANFYTLARYIQFP